ncbi:hypothetical protein J5Y09_17630 [Roseomonas sp. PWR1]|uniref:Heparinase n=1 Tax=Roseomonas nitratireducens TaxID=2820810 RepID=A0ABS4AWL4_9PROT|nr:hypothetical protein [Neoroseomonas nitratireducens]MBP0465753.1 hypothetical protein [Neoroseomonas nitratireducens]
MGGTIGDAVRDGLARGLLRFRAAARVQDREAMAFAETPGGSRFDLAANAAAAEALAAFAPRDAEGALALIAAGQGPAPAALDRARLVVEDGAPRTLRIATPHHLFTGDLFRGELRQALHGDGAPFVLHGGNLAEFTLGGRRHCLDVEDAIVAAGVEATDDGVRLFHESILRGRGRFGPVRDVARLRYAYEIRAATPALLLTVTLAPLLPIGRVRATTACDAMSPAGAAPFAAIAAGGAWREVPAAENMTMAEGPVGFYAVRQAGPASRAARLRVVPHGPVLSVKTSAAAAGQLHWLLARHAAGRLAPGATLTVTEERLLLRGGDAPLAAPRGADAASRAPHGRLAAALARCGEGEAARRHLAALAPEETAPAELGHALLAALALGDGPAPLAARLLALEADGLFLAPGGAPARIEDQATTLRALALLQMDAPTPQLGAALARGLAALALTTLPGPRDAIAAGPAIAETAEALALLLRALRAAQAARARGAFALDDAAARRLALLAEIAHRLLQARIRAEGDALLVEGGPAAQAAVLAALAPAAEPALRAVA